MSKENKNGLIFSKENYKWLLIGVAITFVGFILMSGGAGDNPNEFHPEELFSWRRITLAPFLVLAGFGVVIYAIMKKPKHEDPEA